ncbi:MAG: DNA alkylation repair protein [Elusimicrobiaceae bacterium]|nr:DNA alkylation repair protein [Elusimicrobiaceae bacterium]
MTLSFSEVEKELLARADSKRLAGMARYGITAKNALGVSMPEIRALARRTGRNAALARQLWASGVHEMRILAGLVHVPGEFSGLEADAWCADFHSWDVCDQTCLNLVRHTPFARAKTAQWAEDEREFVRRAGFSLMAVLAVHDKAAADAEFVRCLSVICRYCGDERNMVKKAVNWALRQIGKRNAALNAHAIEAARAMLRLQSRAGNWIARDALRELCSESVARRLKKA